MRVYVIRHGESENNRAQKYTGWADVHLTEKGRRDALLAADFLKNISFDKVYSSDLARAKETAECALPLYPYEESSLLREIDVGDVAGKPFSVLMKEEKERIPEQGYKPYGGESREEFHSRICSFQRLLEERKAENVAVFAHAGFLREMLDTVVGFRLPRNKICCDNCAVAVFEYDGDWHLHSWVNFS
ncbi:MAG: histidine phosphatase family protein [Clostridia bacterium]|nr:histidine phosphatase family protein [Clostridia bacterium]